VGEWGSGEVEHLDEISLSPYHPITLSPQNPITLSPNDRLLTPDN
jgi:hypothetical protein